MTRGTKICLAAVLVILIVSAVLTVIFMRPVDKEDPPKYVEIVCDNEVLYRIDIANESNRSFIAETPYGWNEITIKDGEICVSDADCPDKTCVHTGVLRSEYVPIICLPHRLSVRFAD